MKTLIFFISLFLIGCSADKQKKTTATLFVSSKNLVTASTGSNYSTSSTYNDNSGTILYMINRDQNKQRTIILNENTVKVELDFGNWDLAVLAWAPDYDLRCGKVSKNFNSVEDSLNIVVSEENCLSDFFSPASSREENSIKYFGIINCTSLNASRQYPFCESTNRGGAGSYAIKVITHDYMNISEIPNLNPNSQPSAAGDCFQAEPSPEVVHITDAPIPLGTSLFKMPIVLETYSDNNCTQNKSVSYFPSGFGSAPTSGDYELISTGEGNFIFTNYKSLILNGLDSFNIDPSSQNSTTGSLTLVNNTNSPISNIVATVGAPFSVIENCTDLAINASCIFSISFNPSTYGTFPGILSFTYTQNNQTKTYNQPVGSQIYSPPSSGILEAINTNIPNIPEDALVTSNLYYTAQPGVVPTKCEIVEMFDLKIVNKCKCSNGSCSATFKSMLPHFSGQASFQFTLGTETITSQVGTTTINFSPVEDNLVARNMSRPASSTLMNIKFDYYDPDSQDGSLASNNICSIVNPINVDNSTLNCECNTDGECSANAKITTAGSPAVFRYKIGRNNGSYSNEAFVFLYPNPNSFVTVNQQGFSSVGAAPISGKVSEVIISGDHKIYVATNNGVYFSGDQGKTFSNPMNSSNLASPIVNGLYVESDHMVFVGTQNGLSKFGADHTFLGRVLNNIIINDVWKDEFGTLFVSTNNGVYISHDNGGTFSPPNIAGLNINKTRSFGPSKIYAASNSGLWISNNSGVSFTLYSQVGAVPLEKINDFVLKLNPDSQMYEEMLYLATDTGFKIIELDGNTYTASNKPITGVTLPSPEILSIHEDQNGIIFLGTSSGVFYTLDGGSTFKQKNMTSGIVSNIIHGVTTDANGALYLATANGLSISFSNIYLAWMNSAENFIYNLNFGNISTGLSSTTIPLKISNYGNRPIENFNFVTTGPMTLTSTQPSHECGQIIEPLTPCGVYLHLNVTGTTGPLNGYLQFYHYGQMETQLPLSGYQSFGP